MKQKCITAYSLQDTMGNFISMLQKSEKKKTHNNPITLSHFFS